MKTIVYVHGLSCTSKIFSYLHSQLPKHKAIFIEYDSSQPIEESFSEVTAQFPLNKKVTVIGHSLGGILGHLITTRLEGAEVERLISISTPFGGSQAANKLKWFYPGFRIFRDICTTSKIINEVTSTPVTSCPFTSLISTRGHLPFISEANDGVVSIKSQESTVAEEIVHIHSNHFEVLQDPLTVSEVKRLAFGPNK